MEVKPKIIQAFVVEERMNHLGASYSLIMLRDDGKLWWGDVRVHRDSTTDAPDHIWDNIQNITPRLHPEN